MTARRYEGKDRVDIPVPDGMEETVAPLREMIMEAIAETDEELMVKYFNGEEFTYLKKCLNECYPEAGVIPYLMTGGTDCRHYEEVADNCLRFCPIKMSNEQLAAMHAANESIGVSETAHCVKFYKHYIKNHK